MWLSVTQVFVDVNDRGKNVRVANEVNTDLIERIHDSGKAGLTKGGLTLHLQSGTMIDIDEDWTYWNKHVPVGDQ